MRFTNIEQKIYWHDEIYTSLHISGFFSSEWRNNLFTGEIIEPQQLQYYLQSHSHKTFTDTVKVLGIEDPHHPPLYYILVREWRHIFGDSIAVIRSFSAWSSLLIFPAIYWLAWELFKQPIVSWISVALIAISPFHILYAQEAREYAFWTVLIILLNASLLRCIELTISKDTHRFNYYLNWIIYTILTILSFYTSLFTLFVVIAQIFYTLLLAKFKLTKFIIFQGFSLIISMILFSPWIIRFINSYTQYKYSTAWTREFHFSPFFLLKTLGFNLTRIFVDFSLKLEHILTNLVILICSILLFISLYFLKKNTSKESWLFVIIVMFVPVLCLLIPDMLIGGVRSLSPRYLIPFYVTVHITIAYLLGNQLILPQIFNTKIWSVITLIIFSVSLLSSIMNLYKDTAYTKVISYNLPQIARIVNESDSPLLVSDYRSYHPGNIMALSYLLDDDVKLQLLSNTDNYQPPKKFKDIFFLNPPNNLKESLQASKPIKVKRLFQDDHLWLYKVNFSE
ncbi:glycosyltransferase family 39 protein [Crocosphaera sp. Alani8]|uniref:glycosyltransferase family 39 protein n=1 Tax=Crocosphaera sp. Alani8 TaxID=3038952 RepID=UPI00313AC65B